MRMGKMMICLTIIYLQVLVQKELLVVVTFMMTMMIPFRRLAKRMWMNNKSSSRTSGSTIRCSIGAVGDAAKKGLAMRHRSIRGRGQGAGDAACKETLWEAAEERQQEEWIARSSYSYFNMLKNSFFYLKLAYQACTRWSPTATIAATIVRLQLLPYNCSTYNCNWQLYLLL